MADRGDRSGSQPTLFRDALVTIATRFGLALLILGTDVLLAYLIGPAAKGRFTLIVLYSQLAAMLVGWGTDNALAVVSGRDRDDARRGLANALVWSAIVGGFAVVVSAWLYGIPTSGPPRGPLAGAIPNLSASQFLFAAVAIPGELFFALGLFALLGRQQVIAYSVIRIMRRGVLLVLCVAAAAIATLSLDVALLLNLLTLVATSLAIGWVAWRDRILSLRPSLALLREELRFGSRAIGGALAERLLFRADAFLVNLLVGVTATGVYSVTSGLAETLWYIPNALGIVMFSRAVDPEADAARIAAVLTRTTFAVTLVCAIPAFIVGPWLVETVYGSAFRDAGFALRWILPGVVAYSAVAIISRYVVGQGRPGAWTLILLTGLGLNLASNVILIPRLGINGAALSSSISYVATAFLTVIIFRRLSGLGYRATLVVQREDIAALRRRFAVLAARITGRQRGPIHGLPGGPTTARLVMDEREPGEEP